MNFAEFFIKRPVLAIVCSLITVIAGIACVFLLPVAQFPQIAPPDIAITSIYTGANSEVVESAVTIPLEQELNGLEGARYINSSSSNTGISNITVTLEPSTNVNTAILDIQNRVKRAEARLPEDVKRNGVVIQKTSSSSILLASFFSPTDKYDSYFISNYVDKYVKDAVKRVPGVGDIEIFGIRKYAMRIWLDPNKIAQRKISIGEIVSALREQNIQVPAGQIGQPPYKEGQSFQMNVKVTSRLQEPAEFEDIVIKTGEDGSLVRIKDIAKVELGAEDYSSILSFNHRDNIVGMMINQLPDANALDVEKNVKLELEKLSKNFPPELNYVVAFNPTDFVRESIDEVIYTLVIAVILVILVIYLFIQSFRSSLIPAITIPVSLIGTFIFIKLCNFSINTLTLFGLTLATGLVVDDAIIVLENISRFIQEKNMKPLEASIEAMKEISGAVVATSLVLIAVFVPVSLFPGTTGKLYQQFALTIAFSIAISTFNALTLSPALSAIILKHEMKNKQGIFFDLFNKSLTATKNFFKKTFFFSLRHQWVAIIFYISCILGIFFVSQAVPRSFLPQEDQGYFFVAIEAPPGSSIEYTKKVTDKVEAVIRQKLGDNMQSIFSVIGFSFLGSGPNKAMLFPSLKSVKYRKEAKNSATAIVNSVRMPLMGMPGALVMVFEPPSIAGLDRFGGFNYKLKAEGGNINLDKLAEYTQMLAAIANQQKELQGVYSTFTTSDPQVEIKINRDLVKSMGINLTDIFSVLQAYLGSYYVNDFDMQNRVYRVYIQADKEYRSSPENINSFYVKTNAGNLVPLGNLVTIKEVSSAQNISHFNSIRSTDISGSAKMGFSSGQAMNAMERISKQYLPTGMSFEWSGISKEEKESGAQTLLLFILGLTFTFLVLSAQYENFIDPVIILLVVPLAIFGGLGGVLLRGQSNDVYCQIGLIMLVGCASKNSILIVEYANQLRQQGFSILRAVIQSTMTRFRPILMTASAFILGVLPLVFAEGSGSASRHSLGTPIATGMLFSTVLSLLIVPVLYFIVTSFKEKLRQKVSKLRYYKNTKI